VTWPVGPQTDAVAALTEWLVAAVE